MARTSGKDQSLRNGALIRSPFLPPISARLTPLSHVPCPTSPLSKSNRRAPHFAIHEPLLHELFHVHLEGLHAVKRASLLHEFFERRVALRAPDGFAHRSGRDEHLGR